MIKLGVNVDHVATLREARKGREPDPVQAALEAEKGGADGITVHLREDRRHIQDHDLFRLKRRIHRPMNLEMALVPEIVKIAIKLRPEKVCLVPERRREVTTEGGLDVVRKKTRLKPVIQVLAAKGIEVSLFIDPEIRQVQAAKEVGAEAVEFHTGSYANALPARKAKELSRLKKAAIEAHRIGLKVHAGHGLNYENVAAVAKLPFLRELNIGHSIISRATFVGIKNAVREMKRRIKSCYA